ncbi:MAG: DUF1934 domain-containing protein [Oscillospiraceae bacterium]|jgi:uncharacterized beta-barrel protein YwiB (DUF1934 family)|nr:DUF1934 domain-containing protein [Oscillospiraceae bacterium]
MKGTNRKHMDWTISILGSQQSFGDDDEEQFELITEGSFSRCGDKTRISYSDVGMPGPGTSETTFLVEPSRITLTRASWYGGDMVFDEKKKHHFLYQTPFGALTMGIDTESITRELNERGGGLHIKYALDVDNVVVSRNSFKIDVKPA